MYREHAFLKLVWNLHLAGWVGGSIASEELMMFIAQSCIKLTGSVKRMAAEAGQDGRGTFDVHIFFQRSMRIFEAEKFFWPEKGKKELGKFGSCRIYPASKLMDDEEEEMRNSHNKG